MRTPRGSARCGSVPGVGRKPITPDDSSALTDRTETSAGGVVVRRTPGSVDIAVGEQRDRLTGELTTRLPKGIVEADETPEQAAVREVAEETGLEATLVASLGSVEYAYREREAQVSKRVHFFLMEALSDEPGPRDGELQRVYWCPLDAALERLTYDTERRVVQRARKRLEA